MSRSGEDGESRQYEVIDQVSGLLCGCKDGIRVVCDDSSFSPFQEDFEEEVDTASLVSRTAASLAGLPETYASLHEETGSDADGASKLSDVQDLKNNTSSEELQMQLPTIDSRRVTAAIPFEFSKDRSQASSRNRSLSGESKRSGRSTIIRQVSRSNTSKRASETSAAASDKCRSRQASDLGFSDGSEQLGAMQETAAPDIFDRRVSAAKFKSRSFDSGPGQDPPQVGPTESLSSLGGNETPRSMLGQLEQPGISENASLQSADVYTAAMAQHISYGHHGLADTLSHQHDRYPEDDMGRSTDTTSPQQQLRWAGASHRFSQQVSDMPSSRGPESKCKGNNRLASDLSLQKQALSQNQLSVSMPRPQTPDNSNQASHRPSDQAASHSHSPTGSERTAFSYHEGDFLVHCCTANSNLLLRLTYCGQDTSH